MILLNSSRAPNHWIGLRLTGRAANRDAVGALVRWSSGGMICSQLVNGGGSYLSSHDPRIVLGLGREKQAGWIEVRWPAPSRRVDRFENVAGDRYYALKEGEGLK